MRAVALDSGCINDLGAAVNKLPLAANSPLDHLPDPSEVQRRICDITREERHLRQLLRLAMRVRADRQPQKVEEVAVA